MAKAIHPQCGGEFDTDDVVAERILDCEWGKEIEFRCPCCGEITNSIECP